MPKYKPYRKTPQRVQFLTYLLQPSEEKLIDLYLRYYEK